MKKLLPLIKLVIKRNKFLSEHESTSNLTGKVTIQFVVAFCFLILSVANIITKSYLMLFFTLFGFVANAVFSAIAAVTKNEKLSTYSSIILCSVTFAVFVVRGGNDGFAGLWIALFPIFSMAMMDVVVGFISSVILQIFLITVLWTPINELLLYRYNEQFCLRFPVFFFVSMLLGLITTISLQKSQYNAQQHLIELKKVTDIANRLAMYDPLTGLSNRRCAYEIFNKEYSDESVPHSIVMGDIDKFKSINDSYGHESGDEVLVTIANYIKELLPESYIKARWGGEEFLIAANEPIDSVFEKIEMLRVKISEHEFQFNGDTVKTTVSFGIAEYYKNKDLNLTIDLADSRLYIGKKTTMNCTVKQ